MLISAPAIVDLTCRQRAARDRSRSLIDRLFRRRVRRASFDLAPPEPAWNDEGQPPQLRLLGTSRAAADAALSPQIASAPPIAGDGDVDPKRFRWRRHPQLRDIAAPLLEEPERDARLAAVRGVFAARDGDYAVATSLFTTAAGVHAVEFGEVPGFWQLSRRGMQCAIDAYEAVGRLRDAAALAAVIRHRFRPHAVRPVRPTLVTTPSHRVGVGD